MTSSHSRFEAVSRRAFVTRSLIIGALVVTPGLACSKDDKQTFATTKTTSGGATTSTTAATAGSSGATAAGTATTAAAAAGSFPTGGSMTIAFTFGASGGGGHSPYIAVWIENSAGEMVKTVSLWYKARDSRYLNDLQRWATVETAFQNAGKTDPYDTVSGATRVAGAYSVTWDGTDATGAPVALGQYYVCIEAAREKGPYELIRGEVAIADTAATTPLADNGELTGASVALVV